MLENYIAGKSTTTSPTKTTPAQHLESGRIRLFCQTTSAPAHVRLKNAIIQFVEPIEMLVRFKGVTLVKAISVILFVALLLSGTPSLTDSSTPP